MKVKGKYLILLRWDSREGKHQKIILNSALRQGKKEFYVIGSQGIGYLEKKDLI